MTFSTRGASLVVALIAAGTLLLPTIAPVDAQSPQQAASAKPQPQPSKPPTRTAPAPPRPPASAAAAAAAAKKKIERQVPFKLGETLSYDISWAAFMTAATATVSVKEKRPSYDSVAYYIVAEGQPTALVAALYKLYYKADTLLDAYTLLPQRGSLYSREAGRQHLRATRFLQDTHTAQYQVQSGATLTTVDANVSLEIPASTQDAVSAIYALRTMELRPGASMVMPVSINGGTYRVRVTAGNREPVSCGLGTVTAWKLMPSLLDTQDEAEAQNMAIWISDDPRRLPVLMQADFAVGTFKLTLRSASGS